MARIRNLHDDTRNFKRLVAKNDERVVHSTPRDGLYKMKCGTKECSNYVKPPQRKCDGCLGK